MTLLNVAYISGFMTNLVSQSILASKGVYFDGKTKLIQDNITIGLVEPLNGHYILERSEISGMSNTFLSSSAVKTMNNWHHVLGHASHQAIKHLSTSAQGVKVLDINAQVPNTGQCETCALFKSRQIISRSPNKSESSSSLFHWTTYDLMQFELSLNKHQWVSHFACSYIDFNLVSLTLGSQKPHQ